MTRLRTAPGVANALVALGVGAAAVGALAIAPSLLPPGQRPEVGGPAWWAIAAVIAVQSVALMWVAVIPRAVVVATAALAALLGIVVPTGIGNLADAVVLVALVRTVLLVSVERLRVVLPVVAALVAVGQAADGVGSGQLSPLPALASGLLQAVAIVGLPAAGVLAVSARREARQARSGERAAIDREHDALVRAAVADERVAMARELHDIAAHHVSSIALMSAAVARQIDSDPEGAKRAVTQVREQSRALLDDLRRLVGLLRDGSERDAVPTVAAIPALIAAVSTAAGRPIGLRDDGGGDRLGPLSQTVVYRTVQEALANAAQHAPAADWSVELGARSDRFVAVIRNGLDPSAPDRSRDGFGILGMGERAELVGGTLTVGPEPDGDWVVRLELPLDAATETSAVARASGSPEQP